MPEQKFSKNKQPGRFLLFFSNENVWKLVKLTGGVNLGSKITILDIKGPVTLKQGVKIAHSFLQSVSNQFHVIILSLPM